MGDAAGAQTRHKRLPMPIRLEDPAQLPRLLAALRCKET